MKILFFLLILFVILIDIIQSDDFQNDNRDKILKPPYGLRTLDSAYDFQRVRVKRSNVAPMMKQRIDKGIKGAVAFIKFLKEKNFSKMLFKITSVVSDIFGIASGVITITLLLIESNEMQLMKKEFTTLNNKIDRWGVEFMEIKKMIEWGSVQVQFSDIENRILILHKLIENIMVVSDNYKQIQMEMFMNKYETDYRSAGDTLYLALTRDDLIFSENLFKAVQKYTQHNRRKVSKFMTGMTQLLTQAIKIEAIYVTWKYNNTIYDNYLMSLWTEKINILKGIMETIDNQTKNQYVTQYHIDLDNTLKSYVSQSNEQFLTTLYNVLENKYDWRDWFVLVYGEVRGFKYHYFATRQGTHRFGSYGRNVIVSSVDKEDRNRSMSSVERSKLIIGRYTSWHSQKLFAKGWVNYFTENNEADTRAAIVWGSNVWFEQSDLVVYKKNCVDNYSPCYNTFLFA